ncbi:hypothetical protein [Streptosporangium saharense]|uniref:hypothetical protein n=1 Tax=Streptosporangium saharense TaxID=1706840 RepID=UPI0033199191
MTGCPQAAHAITIIFLKGEPLKRIMIAALAAVGLLAATPSIANAADEPGTASAGTPGFVNAADEPSVMNYADEWYTSTTHPESQGYGYVGSVQSTVGGVWQWIAMWRKDNYVVLRSGHGDDREDGYCAGAEIRYQIYDGDTWSGYHYRMIPSYECRTGRTSVHGWYYSKYKVRNVSSRACHVNTSGEKIECEGSWHGPI